MPKPKQFATEVATNAFGIFKVNQNAVTYGAFGCCGFIIQDKKTGDYLLSHIGQESILSKPVADRSLNVILEAYKEAGYDIRSAEVKIVHSHKIQDIFPNAKPENLSKEFSDAFRDNKFVMGIPANEFLQSALNRRGIEFEIEENYNNNICDFLLKSVNGILSEKRDDPTVKTDIAIINGKVYYQNTDTNNKLFIKGNGDVFQNIEVQKTFNHEIPLTKEMVEGLDLKGLPPFGTMINPFDAVGLHIKKILGKNPDKILDTLSPDDVRVLLQSEFQILNQSPSKINDTEKEKQPSFIEKLNLHPTQPRIDSLGSHGSKTMNNPKANNLGGLPRLL